MERRAPQLKTETMMDGVCAQGDSISDRPPAWVRDFKREGVAVIPNFITEIECLNLIMAAEKILSDLKPALSSPKTTLFNGDHPCAKTNLDLLYKSAESVKYFWEAAAVTEQFTAAEDPDTGQKFTIKDSISKLGYGLHFESEAFKQSLIFGEEARKILKLLEFQKPKVAQSMYIFKQAKIGDRVPPHRDASYLYNERTDVDDLNPGNNLVGFWLALEDADEGNACLKYVPGSHINKSKLRNIVRKRLVRVEDSGRKIKELVEVGKEFYPNDPDTSSDEAEPAKTEPASKNHIEYQNNLIMTSVPVPECADDGAEEKRAQTKKKKNPWKSLPVEKGSLVLIHGSLIHKSSKNKSDRSRNALSWHVIESGPNLKYSDLNWLQLVRHRDFPGL